MSGGRGFQRPARREHARGVDRGSFAERPRSRDLPRAQEPLPVGDDDDGGARVVFGIHAVTEALRARPDEVEHVFALGGRGANPRVQSVVDLARERGVALRFVDKERLAFLSERGEHQGVAAMVASFRYADLDEVLAAPRSAPLLLLALDGVVDPRNLGAVLRSAEALGAHGVVIPKDRAAGVTPVASKVAAGAAERIPVARVTNLVRALLAVKAAGGWVIGAAADAPTEAAGHDFSGATCLVVGGEAKGLRPLVARTCDAHVRIPLAGATSSLNASIAAAVLLYEVQRQRSAAKSKGS